MSVSISAELREAIAAHPGEPVELVDDLSQSRYVVLPGETFDRIKALLTTDDFEIRETYAAQSSALASAGWNDPEMDIYNDYDAHRQ